MNAEVSIEAIVAAARRFAQLERAERESEGRIGTSARGARTGFERWDEAFEALLALCPEEETS